MSRDLQEGPKPANPPAPDTEREGQTYTATIGLTIYAQNEEEADFNLEQLFEFADCVKYANVHDMERDEGEV